MRFQEKKEGMKQLSKREVGESGNIARLLNSLRVPLTFRSTGLSTKS